MDGVLGGAIQGAIIGGIAGGLGALLFVFFQPRRKCPDCGEQLPTFRKTTNKRQMLWGGWTCPNCGCEVDRKGRKIEPDK